MTAPWSEQKLRQFRRLWKSDMPRREIAQEMGTSVGHTYRVARREGLEPMPAAPQSTKREMPDYQPQPGWPTKAQLMAGSARVAAIRAERGGA